MSIFPKKGCYHSELVKAGAVTLQFTSDVLESKYAGKPPFVAFKLEDGTEHTLTIENDGVRATIENLPKNEWLTVHAAGSRDLAVISVDEAPTLGQISQARKPAPAKPTVAATNIQPSTALADQLKQCLKVAHDIEVWYEQEFGEPLTENTRALAIAIEKAHNPGKQLVA